MDNANNIFGFSRNLLGKLKSIDSGSFTKQFKTMIMDDVNSATSEIHSDCGEQSCELINNPPFISSNSVYAEDAEIKRFVGYLFDKPNLKKFIYSLPEEHAVNIMRDLGIEICIIKLMRFKARQIIEMSEEEIERHVTDLLWARSGASKAKWDGTVLVGGIRHEK